MLRLSGFFETVSHAPFRQPISTCGLVCRSPKRLSSQTAPSSRMGFLISRENEPAGIALLKCACTHAHMHARVWMGRRVLCGSVRHGAQENLLGRTHLLVLERSDYDDHARTHGARAIGSRRPRTHVRPRTHLTHSAAFAC